MKIRVPNLTPIRRIGRHGEAAFTMVEVAMSLAIVAFALVAIMGVMPTGLNVQRQNREETVISQDASFIMEAIKAGEDGRYLDIISANLREAYRTNVFNGITNVHNWHWLSSQGRPEAGEILGYICRPQLYRTSMNMNMLNSSRLRFKAFSGNMATLAPQFTDTFEYEVVPEISLIDGRQGVNSFTESFVGGNLYSVKLKFRWPVLPNGELGLGEKEFVTQVTGFLAPMSYDTNNNTFTAISTNSADFTGLANIAVNPHFGFIFGNQLIRGER